jgi:thiol-disulfide isomerase/thioredoxin
MKIEKIISINRIFLTTFFFMISSFLTAQVLSNTLGEFRSDSSELKLGQLIMEMPFGAKLFKNYDNAQDLIDNLKNYCKGKAIFIDYWATWCRPCLQAMPYTKRLYIETKNLPIEFIYICTDNSTNIDNWITKISILQQPGIHIFVKDEIIREMWRLFPIGGGFPTYVFIDKNGTFKPEAIPANSSTPIDRLSGLIKK